MYIFIDESGPFAVPRPGTSSMCCVATLAIGEAEHEAVLNGYSAMAARWPLAGDEPKGSRLSDRQFDRIITFLSGFDVVLTIDAIDMGQHTAADIAQHQADQAAKMQTSADGPEYFESMRESVRALAARVASLSQPLYVQSILLTKALWEAVQATTLRYAQTQPAALGNFAWRIDAKDRTPTPYERLWTNVVKPLVQSVSLREGLMTVREFDYSAMARFENPTHPRAPAHLEEALPEGEEGPFHSFDARKIIDTDLRFEDSKSSPGLQLADILASAFRRACTGRLGPRGWRRLGGLLVRDPRGGSTARYMVLTGASLVKSMEHMPYAGVAQQLDRQARPWEVARARGH